MAQVLTPEGVTTREILNYYPKYIWVIGTYASGKTTISKQIEKDLQGKVERISDGKFFLQALELDWRQEYHRGKLEDGDLIVTSTQCDDVMNQLLVRELERFDGDVCVIEKATGFDEQGVRDNSLMRLTQFIPRHILDRSVFVYVDCPFKERFRRNKNRPDYSGGYNNNADHRQLPDEAMIRFSQRDDFHQWRQFIIRPVFVIDNS